MINVEKLKQLRKERHLLQSNIARMAGISGNYYSEIETGQRSPSLETTIALAHALGVTVNDILLDCGISNPPLPSETAPEPPGAERRTAWET
jgi:transcriptional regulator with XRE-family HTH domain